MKILQHCAQMQCHCVQSKIVFCLNIIIFSLQGNIFARPGVNFLDSYHMNLTERIPSKGIHNMYFHTEHAESLCH